MSLLLFSNFQINFQSLSNISLDICKSAALFVTHFLAFLIYLLILLWTVFWHPLLLSRAPSRIFMIKLTFTFRAFKLNQVSLGRGVWGLRYWMRFGERFWGGCINLLFVRDTVLFSAKLYTKLYTKARLAKIYEGVSPTCDRCKQSPANLIHALWHCLSLHSYWTAIFNTLSGIVGEGIKPNALSALFGVAPSSLTKSKKDVLAFATLLARRRIVINWKSTIPPCHGRWIRVTLYFLKLEKIRLSLLGCSR